MRGALIGAVLLFAACGNYSNDDLEFMNAVPASVDIAAVIPRSMILPANEAELSRLTHDVITTFNGALDFLNGADLIRMYQPTSRIPNGRVWGPFPMDKQPTWQWRFIVTRDPATPEMFRYYFEVQPIGAGDTWTPFIDGSFVAAGGVRKGMGRFHMGTDALRAAGFPVEINAKGELLKDLDVMYWTAAFPVSVTMMLTLYPDAVGGDFVNTTVINYHHEAEESGAGLMTFSGTDSKTGASISVVSQWMASGRGRADATATDGTVSGTRTECWDDSFRESYNNTPWDATVGVNHGDIAVDCPSFSMP